MTAATMTTPRPPRRTIDPDALAAAVNLRGPEAEVRERIAVAIRQALLDFSGTAQLTRTCPHCFRVFRVGCRPLEGRRSDAVYCSDSCRVAAFRSRGHDS